MRCSRFWLSLASFVPLLFTACATIGPPRPPSLDLPKPPSDLRASRKGDKVTLTWTIPTATTDRQVIHSVGPTQICRGPGELKTCGTPAGEAPAQTGLAAPKSAKATNSAKPKKSAKKVTASYTDTLPTQMQSGAPDAVITYAVEVLNQDHRGAGLSNLIRVPLVRTLPPPPDFRAEVRREGVVLSWAGDPSAVSEAATRYSYRVYRTLEGSTQATLVGELPASGESHFSLTDSEIEWQKTYNYRADTVTTVREADKPEVQVEGEDTAAIKVFANDVFPPAVPSGLQAVFSGPGQKPFIDLVWAPVSDADLAGYNIYRHQQGTQVVKLNAELVKTPAYRDASVAPGNRYFYSVSAVDVRGNESAASEEAGETVPQ
jgi:hypothetical protein